MSGQRCATKDPLSSESLPTGKEQGSGTPAALKRALCWTIFMAWYNSSVATAYGVNAGPIPTESP
jgi:hypothetical protein